jgi:hypothetical protein
MRMARNHDLDVLHFEAQFLHVRNDRVVHLVGTRVVENVPRRSGNQIGAILAAHPIYVADNTKRFDKLSLALDLNGPQRFRRTRRRDEPYHCTHQQQPHSHLAHMSSSKCFWPAAVSRQPTREIEAG